MLSTEWNWQEDDFITNTEKSLIIEGYEAPIKDFSISLNGVDYTDSILMSKNTLLVVAYNLEKTEDEAWKRIKELALASELEGITFATLTASTDEKIASFKQQMQIPFPFYFTDETTLKTIIRSNPGVLLLNEGTIIDKWHYNDFPKIRNHQTTFTIRFGLFYHKTTFVWFTCDVGSSYSGFFLVSSITC